jgi:hypothetical protein
VSRSSVKIVNAALDIWNNNIVLRGIIDPDSFELLQVADYQREVLPTAKINELVKALEGGGRFPDVELGSRSSTYVERDGNFYLPDDIFIIDGLQRITAGQRFMKTGPDRIAHIGCLIHFTTTEVWERERFRILNQERNKLSPSILIRNMRHELPAIETLFNLCEDKQFVMQNKICWSQQMARVQLITARTFCETVSATHAHISAGRSTAANELALHVQRIMDKIGRNTLRDNVKLFFDIIDQCWGIRTIAYKEGATWMRSTFLQCLGEVFSMHQDFWRDNRLFVEADLVRKIKLFQTTDPYVKELSSARGQAVGLLRGLMIEHINSGKRTRRLRPWKPSEVEPVEAAVGQEKEATDQGE